jgi:hypothetical protein
MIICERYVILYYNNKWDKARTKMRNRSKLFVAAPQHVGKGAIKDVP